MSNADAAYEKANAHGKLVTVWSTYLPKPISRYLEFFFDFDGFKRSISQGHGGGDYIKQRTAASKDGRCVMFVDTQSNEVTIRLDGLINYAHKGAEVIE